MPTTLQTQFFQVLKKTHLNWSHFYLRTNLNSFFDIVLGQIGNMSYKCLSASLLLSNAFTDYLNNPSLMCRGKSKIFPESISGVLVTFFHEAQIPFGSATNVFHSENFDLCCPKGTKSMDAWRIRLADSCIKKSFWSQLLLAFVDSKNIWTGA